MSTRPNDFGLWIPAKAGMTVEGARMTGVMQFICDSPAPRAYPLSGGGTSAGFTGLIGFAGLGATLPSDDLNLDNPSNPGNPASDIPQSGYAWGLAQLSKPGIQTVPKPVAKQVHRQPRGHYGQPWHGGFPPGYGKTVAAVRHHGSPCRGRRRHAGYQEAAPFHRGRVFISLF